MSELRYHVCLDRKIIPAPRPPRVESCLKGSGIHDSAVKGVVTPDLVSAASGSGGRALGFRYGWR